MAADGWRAVKRVLKDARQSRTARIFSEAALREFLRQKLPDIWDWIKEHVHEIWIWFQDLGYS